MNLKEQAIQTAIAMRAQGKTNADVIRRWDSMGFKKLSGGSWHEADVSAMVIRAGGPRIGSGRTPGRRFVRRTETRPATDILSLIREVSASNMNERTRHFIVKRLAQDLA